MLRPTIALAFSFLFASATPPANLADDPTALANTILTKGAQLFDTKDAAAMAETYTDDAELHVTTRREGGGFEVKVYRGKAEIRDFYQDYFKNAGAIQSKNTVDFARLVRPDVLSIEGNFRPDLGSDALPFVQTRIKQGDKWLIERLQLFILGGE